MIRGNLESSFFAQVMSQNPCMHETCKECFISFTQVIDINKSEQVETAPPTSGE